MLIPLMNSCGLHSEGWQATTGLQGLHLRAGTEAGGRGRGETGTRRGAAEERRRRSIAAVDDSRKVLGR